MSSTAQWVLAVIVVLVVLAVVLYLGRDVRTVNQGGTAPVDVHLVDPVPLAAVA